MHRKENKFWKEYNVGRLEKGLPTNFINEKEYRELTNILKKKHIKYKVYELYSECDNKIIYIDRLPKFKCFKIITDQELSHQMIMGSLFLLNLDKSLFGDIFVEDNNYYIVVIDAISQYIKENLTMIGNNYIKLKEVNLNILTNHKRNYEQINLIVPSLRIDIVIARLIHTSRSKIDNHINNKEVLLNYNELTNANYKLHENDVFSIRRYGKYIYVGIIKNTKKDNLVIELKKYIS